MAVSTNWESPWTTLRRRGPLSIVTGTEPLQPPSELVKLVLLSGTFIQDQRPCPYLTTTVQILSQGPCSAEFRPYEMFSEYCLST